MMSTHSEEDRFAAALHQAAGVLPAPSPQELYQGSLRRGHAIRRRRRITAGLGAGLTVGVAAVLAVTLPWATPGRSVASSPNTTAPASVAGPPPTYTFASTAPSASATPTGTAQVLSAFEEMLPAGTSALTGPEGGPGIVGPTKDHDTGLWMVQAEMTVQGSGAKGDSFVSFSLFDGAWAHSCTEAGNRVGIVGGCVSRSLDGGKLFRIARSDANSPSEFYIWLSPSGFTTELSFTSQAVADFPLTASQVDDVLTDPLWATLAVRLPDLG